MFVDKCSKCHTIARPINTQMRTIEWERYVKRMMHKPNSGISDSQGKAIFEFLVYDQMNRKDKNPSAFFKVSDRRRDREVEGSATLERSAALTALTEWCKAVLPSNPASTRPACRGLSCRSRCLHGAASEYSSSRSHQNGEPMRYSITVPDQEYFDKNIPCRAACPIHTECGRYVQAIGISKDEEAYLLARAPNPFAYVLGRICAHPCEDNCRRGKIDEPIAICALKRYATDRHNLGAGHDPARKKLPPAAKRGKRIAIVGAGVCGLTCAHDLALLGYTVEVFESAPVPGGMLYLGIPQFRLPREIIKMEVDNILALGVTLHTRVTLGRDISFAELRSKFDAVLLATGLNKGRELNIPGAHLAGVYNGIDFLINVNLGFEIELGKRVVVVGGGNVAIDVARAAVRLVQESVGLAEEDEDAKGLQPAFDAARMALRSGAEEVELVSLESRAQMPAWKGEVDEAEHEGIVVDNGWGPKEIVGENGVVTGLKVRRCLTVFDENGRFNPAFSDEEKIIPCDSVILAIGQQADLSFLSGEEGVQVTPRGILKIDENLMTTAPGVFAGGDVAFGPAHSG